MARRIHIARMSFRCGYRFLKMGSSTVVASKRAPQVYGDKLDLNVSQQAKPATLPIAWDKLTADEITSMRRLMAKALTTMWSSMITR